VIIKDTTKTKISNVSLR